MSSESIMKILRRPGRPSMADVWRSPFSQAVPLVPGGADHLCATARSGWARRRAPRNHRRGDQLAGSQPTSTLNFSKGVTSCFLLNFCLQGLNLKWEASISGFFQFLANLYSGLNSFQPMNNRVRWCVSLTFAWVNSTQPATAYLKTLNVNASSRSSTWSSPKICITSLIKHVAF